jgi:hypothetical protein
MAGVFSRVPNGQAKRHAKRQPMRSSRGFYEYQEELKAIYARTAWIVELEASRRDGAIDPFPG